MTGLEAWLFVAGLWRVTFWLAGMVHGIWRKSILQTVAFGLTAVASSVFLFSNTFGKEAVPPWVFDAAAFTATPIAAMFLGLMLGERLPKNCKWRVW